MDKIKLIPHEVILVVSIPACNFCHDGTPGPYDFKTVMGPWANGCYEHYRYHAAFSTLGEGKGQLWVTADQVDERDLPREHKPGTIGSMMSSNASFKKRKTLYDCDTWDEMTELVGDGDAVDFL
jgi:hypothetical protein